MKRSPRSWLPSVFARRTKPKHRDRLAHRAFIFNSMQILAMVLAAVAILLTMFTR